MRAQMKARVIGEHLILVLVESFLRHGNGQRLASVKGANGT